MEEKEQKLDAIVSKLAYRKIVYHLLRYPTHKVYGTRLLMQAPLLDKIKDKSMMLTHSSTPLYSTPLSQLHSTSSKVIYLKAKKLWVSMNQPKEAISRWALWLKPTLLSRTQLQSEYDVAYAGLE